MTTTTARRWRLSDQRHRRLDAWGRDLFSRLQVEPRASLVAEVLARLAPDYARDRYDRPCPPLLPANPFIYENAH